MYIIKWIIIGTYIPIILLMNRIRYLFFLFFIVSFTDALDKAKRGLYTSDLDDFEAQTTSITSKI